MHDSKARIFVSYRRADSAAVVDHLYDRLVGKYGKGSIFRDIDNIPLGKDFRQHIRSEIGACDIVLAVIGRNWCGGRGGSANRIARDDDPVRVEIEGALDTGVLVIPVLVGGGEMPHEQALPASLQVLPSLNAATLATGQDFEHHLAQLFRKLDDSLRLGGKAIVRRPDWLRPAAIASGIVASTPLVLFTASAIFGIAFGTGVTPIGVILMSLAAALAFALVCVDAVLSGTIGWTAPQRHPLLAGGLLFTGALPLLYWGGSALAAAIPIEDTGHLSKQLLVEFDKARSQRISSGRGDFAASRRIVDAIREIDPDSGLAWYFAGEILRLENPQLFDSQSCFKGWPQGSASSLDPFEQDFYRYLDKDRELGEMTRVTDWGSEVCYSSPKGYCPQRTAWIHQLLAHDSFVDAAARKGEARIAALTNAREHALQAQRFNRPEGGVGFTQCRDTGLMLKEIETGLKGDHVAS